MGTQITEYSPTEAALADLAQRFKVVVFDVRTTQGLRRHREGGEVSIVTEIEAACSASEYPETLAMHAAWDIVESLYWPRIREALLAAEEMCKERHTVEDWHDRCKACEAEARFRKAYTGE